MATKIMKLDGIGTVHLYKRKGARNIRLSITGAGKVRITMPLWVPYGAGLAFAKQKQVWLQSQIKPPLVLSNGMRIGKSHRLVFSPVELSTVTTRLLADGTIKVRLPAGRGAHDPDVQAAAIKACIRALKREAEDVLPGRLQQLAAQHGFEYKSVEVKQLKSRWGSCDHRKQIVLNCFLMQLSWELIDYVLLHELVHTRIMAHGPRFWAEMSRYVPDLPAMRKAMRSHRPTVQAVLGEQ